jgi:thiol protease/hemagglutinin prtT
MLIAIWRLLSQKTFWKVRPEGTDFKVSGIDSIVDYKGRTALYVFNFSPKGFVITSNNVCNEPIVAYSDEGGFEKINKETPSALLYWLSNTILFNEYIRESEKNPAKVIQTNFSDWDSFCKIDPNILKDLRFNDPIDPCADVPLEFRDSTCLKIGHFMTTEWGQWYPYNYYAPKDCPAGCVAVAVGQIMKFHNRPVNSFNWIIMPNVAVDINNPGDNEVALLLIDIGRKVNMNYATNGSGAYSIDARNALVNHYRYSNSANLARYDYNRVINDIANKRLPIYMDGFADKKIYYWRWWLLWWHYEPYEVYFNGHAWVCDGYIETNKHFVNPCNGSHIRKRTRLLHMNWGWGKGKRNYNGWYSENIVDYPPKNDTPEYFIDWDKIRNTECPNFPYDRQCIYDIHP